MPDGDATAAGDATFAPVPPEVERAAQGRDFGRLEAARALPDPWRSFAIRMVVAIVGFGLLAAIVRLAAGRGGVLYPVLVFIGLCFSFVGAGGLVAAVQALVTGARSYFVYENGLVHTHNGTVRTIGWQEVTSLRSVLGNTRTTAGKPLRYELNVPGGKPIPIPARVVDGRDDFAGRLTAALGRFGRPVL